MNSIKTLIAQGSTVAAIMLAHLGYAYQVDGYGLTTMIAYPAATIVLLLPWLMVVVEYYHDQEDDYEHVVLEAAHCSMCGQHSDLINGHCINQNACLNAQMAKPLRAGGMN